MMAPDGSPSQKNGATTSRSGGSSRNTLKKGPWTATEDAILMEYVKKQGEGNWNAVQRNSGLMRCGKSCRLRWANHLRPNLKKGAFSSEEEALIVELHSKLGNKWARMASQLPGRTDNEIKNYWNTRLKRRQRAGLPIYPLEIKPQNHLQQENPQTNPSSSSLVSLLSSAHGQKAGYSTPISIFDMFNSPPPMSTSQSQLNSSYLSDPSQHFKIVQDKNGLALSLSSVTSPLSSISASLAFNNGGLSSPGPSMPMPSLQFSCLNFGIGNSTPVSRASFEQNGVGSGSGMGLPLVQSHVPETTTTPTSSGSDNDYVFATSSDADDHDEIHDQGLSHANSGLLGDLVDESQALRRAKKAKQVSLDAEKRQQKYLWDYNIMEDAGGSGREESGINVVLDQQYQDSSPAHSSIRPKTTNASSEESNPVDDDLLSLLDNFPLASPTPDWYDGNVNNINGQASYSTAGHAGEENHQPEPSISPVSTTPETTDNNWTDDSSCWNNLPGIY